MAQNSHTLTRPPAAPGNPGLEQPADIARHTGPTASPDTPVVKGEPWRVFIPDANGAATTTTRPRYQARHMSREALPPREPADDRREWHRLVGPEAVATAPERKRGPLRRVAGALGQLALGASYVAALALPAFYAKDHDATPTALYAEAATRNGWPGADITNTVTERKAEHERREALENTEARLISRIHTDSGLIFDIYHAQVDASDEQVITVNEEAVNAYASLTIESLDKLDQDLIPGDTIRDFQRRAREGKLDGTITSILSTDPEHRIDIDQPSEFQYPDDGEEGLSLGIGLEPEAPWGLSAGSEFNYTTLSSAAPGSHYAAKKLRPGTTDLAGVIATQEVEELPDPTPAEALADMWTHETLGHALVRAMGVELPDDNGTFDREHRQLTEPIEDIIATYARGRVDGFTLGLPFTIEPAPATA